MTFRTIPGGTFSIWVLKSKMNQMLIHICLSLDFIETIITKIRRLTLNPSKRLALEDCQWLEFVPISIKCGGPSCTFFITVTY